MSTVIESEVVELKTYSVPDCNLESLKLAIEKLNKKAAKLGCKPIELKIDYAGIKHRVAEKSGNHFWIEDGFVTLPCNCTLTGAKMGFWSVTVIGEHPHYNGWEFIASLEAVYTKDEQAENLIKTAPGKECPTEFSLKIGCCDHCGQKRARKKTYVVGSKTDGYKCVGSSCIADFLGGKGPEDFAAQSEWLLEIDEICSDSELWSEGGSSAPRGEEIETLLTCVAWLVSTKGWRSVSSCEFEGVSTVAWALGILQPWEKESKSVTEARTEYESISDAEKQSHAATAKASIEWAASFSDTEVDGNTFLHNCRLIAKCDWVRNKNCGIAAWLVAGYLKHIDRLKAEERKAKLPPSQHVGIVGKRETFKVECLAIYNSEGTFGTTGIHKLVTAEGCMLTWFASESTEWLKVGQKYEIKATVKSHGEYKGQKQTTLSRVSVEHELNANGEVIESIELSEGRIAHCDSPSVPKKLFTKLAKVTKAADEQAIRETICEIIDFVKCDDVQIHWGGKTVSKSEAKEYVMSYGTEHANDNEPAKVW